MPTLKLDLVYMDTHRADSFAIGDVSTYPTGFIKVNPTLEITVPGFAPKSIAFTPSSIQVYNSNTLGITCDDCEHSNLPDGIYKVKYTLNPAYQYHVERSFMRTNIIYSKLDSYFLKLDFIQCDLAIRDAQKKVLDTIEFFIEGAIAAADKCMDAKAMELYNTANEMLDKFNKNGMPSC